MSEIVKYPVKIDIKDKYGNEPIKITQNDYGAITFRISITCSGAPVDLTGNNVFIIIDNKSNTGVCTKVDELNGIVEYSLEKDDTLTVGPHIFVLELVTSSSRVTTERGKYSVIADLNQ